MKSANLRFTRPSLSTRCTIEKTKREANFSRLTIFENIQEARRDCNSSNRQPHRTDMFVLTSDRDTWPLRNARQSSSGCLLEFHYLTRDVPSRLQHHSRKLSANTVLVFINLQQALNYTESLAINDNVPPVSPGLSTEPLNPCASLSICS